MTRNATKSTHARKPAVVPALENDLHEPRPSGATEVQTRPGFSRRQLITTFVLFNLIFWLLVVWALQR